MALSERVFHFSNMYILYFIDFQLLNFVSDTFFSSACGRLNAGLPSFKNALVCDLRLQVSSSRQNFLNLHVICLHTENTLNCSSGNVEK